jgi:1,4-alpha-glucan branching enzyme
LIVNPGSWLLAAAAALILVVGTSAGVSYVRATRLAAATVPSGKNVQFLLVAPGAHKVSVVGDFNGWDAWHAAYQAIHHADGVWTLTALVPTGPHRFAFVVDDSVWMADPNAPRGSGRDYGVPVSALVVGDDR